MNHDYFLLVISNVNRKKNKKTTEHEKKERKERQVLSSKVHVMQWIETKKNRRKNSLFYIHFSFVVIHLCFESLGSFSFLHKYILMVCVLTRTTTTKIRSNAHRQYNVKRCIYEKGASIETSQPKKNNDGIDEGRHRYYSDWY
jgi:hypothetical protein